MIKLNHFICPTCGHDFFTDAAYATCDACRTCFYAGQSRTCRAEMVPKPSANILVMAGDRTEPKP